MHGRFSSPPQHPAVSLTHKTIGNKVFYDPSSIGTSYAEIAERARGLPNPLSLAASRLVVHIRTTEQAIDDFLGLIRSLAEEKRAAGFVRSVEKARNVSHRDMYAYLT
jgi:threonine aldolase